MGTIARLTETSLAQRMHVPVAELLPPDQATALRALRDRLAAADDTAAATGSSAGATPPTIPTPKPPAPPGQPNAPRDDLTRGAAISAAMGLGTGFAISLLEGTDKAPLGVIIGVPAAMLAARRFGGIGETGVAMALLGSAAGFVGGTVAQGATGTLSWN